ncbi:phytanoyl-CoA dioxygenase family protein [Sphingobium fuliginis]|uniref:Phytanoyl-CoA dioxygenase family protein n=1 Tax=Sphingobium fuliginis ATCC 27551 TaxID=1208342 RepID=A0A5B8CJ06_SPHSA|nr:phytanoyl-CoA dioxygenase family protein [Sphingobium fuliginis]QDC38080.1 phytanoyl-CoA dioxygenase family protein [Sphingobium fuliginis ATCC 27551]
MTNVLPGLPLIESPLFPTLKASQGFTAEEEGIATSLYEKGYAVFDFPDADLDARIDRIKRNLAPHYRVDFENLQSNKTLGERRLQDAWTFDQDVRAIASNDAMLDLLSKLYGRRAFPFQTLNFPVGTQQEAHSDSVHFSSLPERFMCGVWLAMEDIGPDSGPLFYYPGSHRWPIMTNALIGRRGYGSDLVSAQDPYGPAWRALCDAHDAQEAVFLARKGQALIWCANLLHGGSCQSDPTLTRWSQVTHYYFDDCIYYTPAFSDEAVGKLNMRNPVAINDDLNRPCSYLGEVVLNAPSSNDHPSYINYSKFIKRMFRAKFSQR